MEHTVMNEDEFGKRILSHVTRKFKELFTEPIEESEAEFVKATIPLEFVVTAKKKKPPKEEVPEPCCVCFRAGDNIICAGECCGEVIGADPVEPMTV